MTAIGYGRDTDTQTDFFILRNAWGKDWGEEGYMRIAAVEGKGICGVQMEGTWS